MQQSQDGIEGYAEVSFEINDDGSTSGHFISDSNPSEYFDAVSQSLQRISDMHLANLLKREHIAIDLFTG